jgi:sugar phosphate isomerase/epimerase
MSMRFFLPVRAKVKSQVADRVRLLEKISYPTGLELLAFSEDLKKYRAEQKRNIGGYQKISLIVHHHYSSSYSEAFDLSNRASIGPLSDTMEFAGEIGAELVVAHPGTFVLPGEWIEGYNRADFRGEKIKDMVKNILEAREKARSSIRVGIENMPLLMESNREKDPERIFYDPVMLGPEDFRQLPHKKGIGLTFDICHYGIFRNQAGIGQTGPYKNSQELPPAYRVIEDLRETVFHVHASDYGGEWVPNKSVLSEGLVLGKGGLGEAECRKIIEAADRFSLSVTFENQVRDLNLTWHKRSIERALGWLNGRYKTGWLGRVSERDQEKGCEVFPAEVPGFGI